VDNFNHLGPPQFLRGQFPCSNPAKGLFSVLFSGRFCLQLMLLLSVLQVFYRTHIICFVGFTMFAYMHYFWSWSYFLPALILYGADLAMRAGQMGNVAVVGLAQDSSTASHPDSDVLTLQLRGSKHLSACPLQDIFCVFPTISRWQWHPFSLAAVERNAKDGAIHLKLHIKRYGNFTKALFEQLRASRYLPVRVSGMASRDAWGSPWLDYHTLLLVGGGVGAAPLLSVINSLIKLKEEHQAAIAEADDKTSKKNDARHTFPSHVSLFWTCRHPEEFAAMADASLLMAAE
jgi:predicted ferric reductase